MLCFYSVRLRAEERKLAESEMPLLVQLNWHKDDREGRFLLRRMDEKTNVSYCLWLCVCVCVLAVAVQLLFKVARY